MANILIVGYERPEAEKLRDKIDTLMVQLDRAKPYESATVIVDVETRWCDTKAPAPYLVVRHSKAAESEAIAAALYAAFNLDIEIEVIHKYLASVPKLPEK